jgi:drug/metabolite transporter (DMT)-like permease
MCQASHTHTGHEGSWSVNNAWGLHRGRQSVFEGCDTFRPMALTARMGPYLLLLGLALVWGVHWPVVKVGLRYIPPFTYGALRIGSALVCTSAVLAWRRRLRLPDRHDLPVVLSVSLGQIGAGILLMNVALLFLAAGRSSVLVYTMPLWVLVMQRPAIRTPGSGRRMAGLSLGLAGIVLLLNPGAIDWGSPSQLLASAALIVSAIVWAGTTIHIRGHEWHGTPFLLEPWQLLIAFVPLVAAAWLFERGQAIRWEPVSVAAVLYSGPLATAVAFWLSQSISRARSPLATTMGFLAVPVVGMASAWLLLGEPLTPADVVGALITFLGILLVSVAAQPDDLLIAEQVPSAR